MDPENAAAKAKLAEIPVEQQPPQGVFVCDHAGLVIKNISRRVFPPCVIGPTANRKSNRKPKVNRRPKVMDQRNVVHVATFTVLSAVVCVRTVSGRARLGREQKSFM